MALLAFHWQCQALYGKQRQVQIPEFVKYAAQGGLIGHHAGQNRHGSAGAILLLGRGQPAEPI
jgi:hypothetical protein